MGQHDPLGPATGAGRINEANNIIACQGCGALADVIRLGVAHRYHVIPMQAAHAGLGVGHRRFHRNHDVASAGAAGGGEDLPGQSLGRDDCGFGLGMIENIEIVVSGVGGIGRHADRANGADR